MTVVTLSLPRSAPEAQGVEAASIHKLVDLLNERRIKLHSLMVVRHGHVIAEAWWEPYSSDRQQMVFSVSKSVTATAIGMAVDEGRLSVDENLADCFPTYLTSSVRRNVAGVKISHLLAMASGHDVDTMEVMRALPDADWVSLFLNVPIAYPPGTHFLYNSGASFVLAALVSARTGKSVRDFLVPRLFDPLGIRTPPWETNNRGINLGASGLRLTSEDMAKLGQLYLRRGSWGGTQLLSDAWISAATSPQISTGEDPADDWAQGYGFQLWRSRHNSFRFDGRYGQFCFVLPDRDMVIAITAGAANSHLIPGLVWDHLLPGVDVGERVLRSAQQTASAEKHLERQEVPVSAWLNYTPDTQARIDGRSIRLPFNLFGVESATLSFDDDRVELTATCTDGSVDVVPAGRRQWLAGSTGLWPHEEMHRVATYSRWGWLTDTTLELHQQCVDTPFKRTWLFGFEQGDRVEISVGLDNGFWVDRTEVLAAHLVVGPG